MLMQYVLTGVAGVMLGIAVMRVWQSGAITAIGASDASVGEELSDGHSENAVQDGVSAAGGSEAASSLQREADHKAPSGIAARLKAVSTPHLMLGGAGLIAVAALAVIVLGSNDEEAGAGAVGTAIRATSAADGKSLDDVDTMIGRLAARLEANPGDGEGFRMLGWSYMMTGHPEKAIGPYKRALALLPDNALVHAGYAEAMTGMAAGKVTAQAKAEFDKAHALDPAEPRTRYFVALWKAQNGQEKQALDEWLALANSGSADAPWQADVRRKITEVSGKLGVDVSGRLKHAPAAAGAGAQLPALDSAAIQAGAALPPAQQQAMIDGMVEGLAAKLKTNPGDAAGWARLLRSRMVLGQRDQARQDLVIARKALASDAAGLASVNAAATAAAVPGA